MEAYTPKPRVVRRTVAFNFTHFHSFWKVITDHFYNQKSIWRAQEVAGGSWPGSLHPGPASAAPDLCSVSAQELRPWESAPVHLLEQLNNGVLYSNTKNNSQNKRWAYFKPCMREQAMGSSHSSRKTIQGGPLGTGFRPCPALLQGHIACGYCPCNSLASSTAPGYELIRPRQGSQWTRRERREKSVL